MSKDNIVKIDVTPPFGSIADIFKSDVVRRSVWSSLEELAFTIERYAKQLTPVDTGRLRASIGSFLFPSKLEGRVGTNVDYAAYVHGQPFYPIQRMRPRPFLTQGVELAQQKISGEEIADKLDKAFTDKFKSVR